MAFKLGSEKRDFKSPKNVKMHNSTFNMNNIKLIEEPLEENTVAEARNDGTICINSDRIHHPEDLKKTIKHEMKHMEDIACGKADYGDNWVMWEDKIYLRHEVDGQMVVDGPNGRWPDGHNNHPWEQEAIAAEDS